MYKLGGKCLWTAKCPANGFWTLPQWQKIYKQLRDGSWLFPTHTPSSSLNLVQVVIPRTCLASLKWNRCFGQPEKLPEKLPELVVDR